MSLVLPSRLPISRVGRFLQVLFLVVLGAALLFYIGFTLHWPMLVDAPIMHYVIFLIGHGLKPYRDITDMNMPGAYLLESFGMLLFGSGDVGWRLYDFFLLAVLMVSMVVVARPYNWLAGVYAAGLFALRHGSEGAWFAGEREQEMTVLLAASCATLFFSVRRARPAFAAGFGVLAGLAAAIKPTLAPFGLCTLVILFFALRRRRVPAGRYLAWSVVGLLTPVVLSVLYLLRYGAIDSFLFVLHSVAPVYRTLNNPGWRFLILHAAPTEWIPLVPLAIVALLASREWNWERSVILLATICGLASYFIQQKGFWHHRYMFIAFGLLLVSMETLNIDGASWTRYLGYAALLYATVYLVPRYTVAFRELPGQSRLTQAMQADLSRLGGERLQNEVQCFDLTFGCLNSLYHMRLMENTGFTGDLLLFPKSLNPATDFYRHTFWKAQAVRPASVLVVTDQEFGAGNSYDRLARWPALATYMQRNYVLAVSRRFPYEDRYKWQPPVPLESAPGYRIYVRKGESFPLLAAGLDEGR